MSITEEFIEEAFKVKAERDLYRQALEKIAAMDCKCKGSHGADCIPSYAFTVLQP